MKVFCLYNNEFHEFLDKVVKQVLAIYGSKLNITSLEEIELVDKNEFSYPTDGKMINSKKIVVTSRLYELLPSFDIDNLEDNNDYKLIINTLYHEMGHISDMVIMKKLYTHGLNEGYKKEQITSRFWLEYIAEKRNVWFDDNDVKFCKDFINGNWMCSIYDPCSNFDGSNFFYLLKVLPYFLAKSNSVKLREKYLSMIKNKLLKDFIVDLGDEIKKLEKIGIFDDILLLDDLYDIINMYYKKFMNAFKAKGSNK